MDSSQTVVFQGPQLSGWVGAGGKRDPFQVRFLPGTRLAPPQFLMKQVLPGCEIQLDTYLYTN